MTGLYLPDEQWQPAYTSPTLLNRTRGEDVVDFAASLLKLSRGFREGQPLIFTDWQRWLLHRLYETKEDGLLRYRRALIGLPRKNGKSLIGTSLALEHLLYGPEGAEIYSAASDRQQASIVFNEARKQVLDNPALSRIVSVYRSHLEYKGRIYRALSADAMRAHGLAPSLVIADELHAWSSTATNKRGDELWEALTQGSADREESLVVAITTAGGDTNTLLGKLYEHGKRVATGEVEDAQFGFWWWEAAAEDDPTDPDTWRKANPNLAEGLMDITDFEAAIAQASSSGFLGFQRYRLNQWVRMAGEDFISAHHWGNALAVDDDQKPITVPLGASVTVGFDGSINNDATGIVVQDVDTGILKVIKVWEPDPTDPEWNVDPTEVQAVIERVFEEYNVELMWFDPSFFRDQGANWARQWKGRVEQIPQTNARIVPLAQQFLKDVISGDCKHDGDAALTRHVLNAIATEAGSYRKEKAHSPKKIDLLACAVMANGARHKVLSKRALKKPDRRVVVL